MSAAAAALTDEQRAIQDLCREFAAREIRPISISVDEAVVIIECRMVLEGLCAAKAAERVTEPEAARLRQLGADMERSVADGDIRALVEGRDLFEGR